jgi:hypothetical protein
MTEQVLTYPLDRCADCDAPVSNYQGGCVNAVLCDTCELERQRDCAADHIRKGWYTAWDLEVLGIAKDKAETWIREHANDRTRLLEQTGTTKPDDHEVYE